MPSPETTALVQRLATLLNGACATFAEREGGYCACGFAGWAHDDDAALTQAIAALSQERTCSTCRFLDYADVGGERPVCQHRDSPLRHLGTVRPEAFGCLLWEQADHKEPA